MKQLYESILSSNGAGLKVRVEKWCETYLAIGSNYEVSAAGVVTPTDRYHEISLLYAECTEIPDYIRWKDVRVFDCSESKLRTLKNCPQGPNITIKCIGCLDLESLEGCPETVNDFKCNNCGSLTTLKGGPKIVKGYFDCSQCFNLKSLEGAPEIVAKEFNCSKCHDLTTLKHSPRIVGGYFNCYNCTGLTALKSSTHLVRDSFVIRNCHHLKSLEGMPKIISKNFYCAGCGEQFYEKDIIKMSNIGGIIVGAISK